MLRSQKNLQPTDIGKLSLLKSMGYSDYEVKTGRPLIGIANSWNTIVPGHFNLNQVSEYVKRGIYAGGGTPVEFGVIGICDGFGQGNDGMHYPLAGRDLIASSVEVMAQAHQLDGLVLLASCDKNIPGMLMAAARLNLPTVICVGGPMEGGIEFDGRKADTTSATEALGMLKAGTITREEFEGLEDSICPGCGSCAFLGTANTMSALSEALGLSLPGSGTIPAVFAERLRSSFEAGRCIVDLCRKDIKARDILTPAAIRNAIRITLAIAGSTNAVLHLSALAREARLDMDVMAEVERLNEKIPQLAAVFPSGKSNVCDFHLAGGVPRVEKALGPENYEYDALTVTGHKKGENITSFRFTYPANPDVIRPLDDPFKKTGGLKVMHGNLCPDTGVSKPAAIAPEVRHFVGNAVCFNCEEDANKAIMDGRIKAGDVLVVRYEGPKGGPGMRELYKAMKLLYGLGLNKKTALITDGRFSGTNNGCFVGHISPEASEGGPIAFVEDGDRILIDVDEGRLELLVSNDVLSERRKNWKKPEKPIPEGFLKLYAAHAGSANRGAMIEV